MGRIFGKKKKTEDRKAVEFCEGVRLLNDPEITDGGREGADYRKRKLRRRKSDSRGIATKCLLEIFIIGGSMCGFLSCIDMAYGVPVIFLAYALLAMYFCGLFKSGKVWVRDVGYVIFLVAFVLFIMLLRRYINSGFYAIVNEFLDHVTDYYGAQEVKVFSETLSNRMLTVPVAAIAIGCVEIIILNIFLNTNMSVFWAVWFSLPVFILPLFFRLEPDVIYMFMVSTGLLGVICLKGNGHFRITDKDSTFEYDEKKRRFSYRHSDRASLQLAAGVAAVCILVGSAVILVKPQQTYLYRYRDSSAKNKIEGPLGNLIMYGFESLRNSANTGGLANGKLGGVSDVTLDGQTDLVITFAPYSTNRIYLKAFVGDEYSWDHWDRDKDGDYPSPVNSEGHARERMDIQNIDGAGDLKYYPYYTDIEAMNTYKEGDSLYSVEYSPSALAEPVMSSVDDKYLEIPEENMDSIRRFCESAGITEKDSVDNLLQKVYIYFLENYPYTLHPGATPRDEDYVNYFLDTTKKGLCANYATAGALILRYMGIPTRYVEGYAVDYTEVLDGTMLDEEQFSYDDYYSGSSELGRTAVVQVDVDDGGAHAWIEAFIRGRWQVVELTPPSSEDEDETQDDFWSRFGRWLVGDDSGDTGTDTTGTAFSLGNAVWIIYVLAGCIAFAVLLFVGRTAVRKIVRFVGYHRRDKTGNVIAYYRYMCDYARLASDDFSKAGNHRQQLEYFCKGADPAETEDLAAYMEGISYGGEVSGDEYVQRMGELRVLFRSFRRQVPFMKRIYIFRML